MSCLTVLIGFLIFKIMETKFKRIKLFYNYSISTDGRVFSHKSKRELSLSKDRDGYLRVTMINDNKQIRTYRVHRLVAETFIANEYNYMVVNHLDNNKLNNDISNLEWCTVSENNKHYAKYFKETSKNKYDTNESLLSDIENLLEKHLLSREYRNETIEKIIDVFRKSNRKQLSWHFKN